MKFQCVRSVESSGIGHLLPLFRRQAVEERLGVLAIADAVRCEAIMLPIAPQATTSELPRPGGRN